MLTNPPVTFASGTQFHVYLPWGQCPFSIVVLNVKALVGAFNQEKALVGAFSVIVQLHRLSVYTALRRRRRRRVPNLRRRGPRPVQSQRGANLPRRSEYKLMTRTKCDT